MGEAKPNPGSIIKLIVNNIMTYRHAVIEPGARLNLVLGPNGTGKSSFVCAICVGLGGSLKLLGRADNVTDFITRGESWGSTEIHIATEDPTRPDVVYRKITNDGRSEWKLNGAPSNQKHVKARVEDKHNVQLDNLCQFMPQDKVASFAALSPTDLLLVTQKSIGTQELLQLHRQLIDNRCEEKDERKALEVAETELAGQRKQQEGLQKDVKRWEERKQKEDEAKQVRSKVPWLELQQEQEKFRKDKDMLKAARESLARLQAEQQGMSEPFNAKKEKAEVKKSEAIRLKNSVVTDTAALNTSQRNLHDLTDSLGKTRDELEDLVTHAEARRSHIVRAEEKLQHAREEQAALPAPPVGNGPRAEELRQRIGEKHQQMHGFTSAEDELRDARRDMEENLRELKGRQSQLENVRLQRLNALNAMRSLSGIKYAADWIEQEAAKGRFRGQVFGPIAVEVECRDAEHVKYLDQHCAADVWQSFVVLHPEDQEAIIAHFASSNQYRPHVICLHRSPNEAIPYPAGQASIYSSYGITHTLDQVFEASHVIKLALVDQSGINSTFVGTAHTDVEKLIEDHPRMRNIFTPTASYRVHQSQYNKTKQGISQSVEAVRPPRHLREGTGGRAELGALERDIQSIQEAINESKHEAAEKQRDAQALQKEIDRLNAEKRQAEAERANIVVQHNNARRKVVAAEKEVARVNGMPDPLVREPALRRDVARLTQLAVAETGTVSTTARALFNRQLQYMAADLEAQELAVQLERLGEDARRHDREVRELEDSIGRLSNCVDRARTKVRDKLNDAKAATGGVDAREDEEVKGMFARLPATLPELLELASELEAEAEGIQLGNPRVMQEFQERRAAIETAAENLKELQEAVDVRAAQIKQLHDQWHPRLKAMVATINCSFQQNCSQVGFAGEVSLYEDEDYDKYAIQIRVKFRDAEELQVLTGTRQSGGERSVSTMMYLISIQEVTKCPFRIVDEINQGMDPVNERKVYLQLVQAACRPGTPQCFLMTPKLLPGLPFTSDVQTLQIWNGTTIRQCAQSYKKSDLLGKRPRITAMTG